MQTLKLLGEVKSLSRNILSLQVLPLKPQLDRIVLLTMGWVQMALIK